MKKLAQLAINDDGFIFDPSTGDAFQVSETALFIIRRLQEGQVDEEIGAAMHEEYDVTPDDAQRDVADFRDRLTHLGL